MNLKSTAFIATLLLSQNSYAETNYSTIGLGIMNELHNGVHVSLWGDSFGADLGYGYRDDGSFPFFKESNIVELNLLKNISANENYISYLGAGVVSYSATIQGHEDYSESAASVFIGTDWLLDTLGLTARVGYHSLANISLSNPTTTGTQVPDYRYSMTPIYFQFMINYLF